VIVYTSIQIKKVHGKHYDSFLYLTIMTSPTQREATASDCAGVAGVDGLVAQMVVLYVVDDDDADDDDVVVSLVGWADVVVAGRDSRW
jgi:hypothetical protein